MGFGSFLEKIGSVFTRGKSGLSADDKIRIKGSVEAILNYGELVPSGGGAMAIVINRDQTEETDKLEKLAGAKNANPAKAQLIDFLLKMFDSKNEPFLRNTFLDFADFEWTEGSIRQSVSTWPPVINDFMRLGQLMPDETNPGAILKKLETSKEEADFLAKKQAIYLKWKDELKGFAKKRKGK